MHPRIDHVAGVENVAEDHLGDGRDRRVLEVQVVAVTAALGSHRNVADIGDLGPLEYRGAAACPGIILRGGNRLGLPGHDVDRSHLVQHVDIGRSCASGASYRHVVARR